ncbi:Gfo/Idh/MocA family oxidoreductase [Phragmitibacter flavus]|uniref:Gfo/Idh/MocA family oxidoreductase n=2 Tax=Phragmitibacter flavus TaxID=2576071 RepID=A0A5R8KIR4_9BACT|nr:Gfo/Idh/MocA family oxidoreductase [Phragmitibacter flavus]
MAGISPQSPILANQGASSSSSSTNIPLAPPDKQPPNLHIPKKAEKTIGWAIVGLGELALAEIMPAFAECQLSKPVALVSGHPDKARKVAALHGIAEDAIYNYDNYDKLAADNRVDAIYIVLPNSMHAEFTIRGLKAGKHVLCEKPMSATVAEAEQMIAAAKAADKKLMIAYRLHYEPFNQKAMELCKSGALGKIKTFVSTNAQNVKAPNIRLSGELAGGPVGDVGVYSINAARYTLGEEPVEVFATAHQPKDDPRFREVPESVTFILRYPSGALAHCDCSFGTSESRFFRVLGTEGYLRMDPAFSYRGLRLHMKEGDAKSGDAEVKELVLQPVNHFAAEMDHFSSVILNGDKCLTPGEMGLADMKIVEAIEKSWKTNEPVKLS